MVRNYLMAIILSIVLTLPGFADEEKVKGVDQTASDIVTNVFKKTNAFFQGNLEISMSADNSRKKNKDNYTMNVLGMKVPKSTNVRN